MNYKVNLTKPFQDDLDGLVLFIAQNSPYHALEYQDTVLRETLDRLSYFPKKCKVYEGFLPAHLRKYKGQIRRLNLSKTTLVYFIIDEERKAVNVLHVKRSWKPIANS